MDVLQELQKRGAVYLDQHFVYKSGKHGPGYINMDPMFPDIALITELCDSLVDRFGVQFHTVAAPATGGIVLSAVTAGIATWRTSSQPPVAGVWADKDGDEFRFSRAGFTDHLRGKRVLVVEDLLTTGGSVMKVCREAERHGAQVIGVGAICNRGGVTAERLGVSRLEVLAEARFEAVDAGECSQCRDHVPIVEDIGHGDKFKAHNPDYPGGYVKLLAA